MRANYQVVLLLCQVCVCLFPLCRRLVAVRKKARGTHDVRSWPRSRRRLGTERCPLPERKRLARRHADVVERDERLFDLPRPRPSRASSIASALVEKVFVVGAIYQQGTPLPATEWMILPRRSSALWLRNSLAKSTGSDWWGTASQARGGKPLPGGRGAGASVRVAAGVAGAAATGEKWAAAPRPTVSNFEHATL